MAANLTELVNKMPELDEAGAAGRRDSAGKFTGIRWDTATKIYDEILAGGKQNIVGLIDLFKEVDNGADYKARYTLHGIALYVCRPGKEKERAVVIDALNSQVGGDRPKPIRGYLVRELQVCGDASSVPVVGKLLLDEELGDDAANAVMAINTGAVEQFRAAAAQAKGRRRTAMAQALGVLKDAQSAAFLKDAAGDADLDTRIVAVWGLANLGDAAATELVIKASNAEGWERIQGVKACLLLAEKLAAAGKKAEAARIYTHLRDSRTDPKEKYMKEAGERGLAAVQ